MDKIVECSRTEVDGYVESLKGEAREWVAELTSFMRENFPAAIEGLCGGAPAYALGKHSLGFAATESCFVFTTNDSECMENLTLLLPDAVLAEDSIMVGFEDAGTVWTLLDAIQDIARK